MQILIVENVDQNLINFSPHFNGSMPDVHFVEVAERDIIIGNTSDYVYLSPLAVDYEDDTISMSIQNAFMFPYLDIEVINRIQFKMSINAEKITPEDHGDYSFNVILKDDNPNSVDSVVPIRIRVNYVILAQNLFFGYPIKAEWKANNA